MEMEQEYPDYFRTCTLFDDAWKKKIQEFGERDLRIQQKLIRLSLGLLQKEQGAQFYTCDCRYCPKRNRVS